MIWIRADADVSIGTGHVMRCISIACSLQELGQEVCFLVGSDVAVPLLEEKGQRYRVLKGSFDNMIDEISEMYELAQQDKPEWCIVDSYCVTSDYLKELGKICKTAYVDDMFLFQYPVDLIINYNIYGDTIPYKKDRFGNTPQLLLGPGYAPLRREFRGAQRRMIIGPVKRILITTGGSDKYNLTGQLLERLLSNGTTSALEYHVVCGIFNQNYPALMRMAESNSQIILHHNVKNMMELMQKCDVAITAGGSTIYELCAVGTPIICFSFVDNQELIVKTFYEKEIVGYGGNYLAEGERALERIVIQLSDLVKDPQALAEYSKKGQALVDGRGAERIAQTLVNLMTNTK